MNRLAFALSLVLVVALAGVVEARPLKVLHVSAFGYDELYRVLETVQATRLFEIDMVTLDEGLPAGWMDYDVIVFGLSDTYETRVGAGRPSLPELRWYVERGGGVVWTHDTLEYGGTWGPDVEEPAGVVESRACGRSQFSSIVSTAWVQFRVTMPSL